MPLPSLQLATSHMAQCTHFQRAGLELITTMAAQPEAAYEQLSRPVVPHGMQLPHCSPLSSSLCQWTAGGTSA